jgi:hypothetical protein
MKGYSLLEVVLAVFILTGLVMAAFSVFEQGSKESLKINSQIMTAELAQEIVEKLHSLYSGEIQTLPEPSRFPPPFQQYEYLYEVEKPPFPSLPNLQKISVFVKGPLNQNRRSSFATSVVNLTFLLAEQPYTPP